MPRGRPDLATLVRWAAPRLAAVAALAGLGYLVIELLPDWFAESRGLSAEGRADARQDVRTTALELLGIALAAVAALYLARLSARGRSSRMTERFTRAIDQLGRAQLEVRLGGVHALARIARDSPQMHAQVMEVLITYVRERSRRPRRSAARPALEPDVQAALTAVGERRLEQESSEPNLVLRGCDLRGANLVAAHLERANLMGADLEGADLVGARLDGANLADANLGDAYLVGTNLAEAVLTRATLDGAYLIQANLERADLTRAQLGGADLVGASLHGADLTDACLEGADLVGAQLEWTDRKGPRLEGADLTQTRLEAANLSRAQLGGADLRGTTLEHAKLVEAQLEGANLAGARLAGADLTRASAVGANLRRARLEGADLTDVDLDGADLAAALYDEETLWPSGFDAEAAVAPVRPAAGSRRRRFRRPRLRPRRRRS